MDTKDKTAPSESPERSSYIDAPTEAPADASDDAPRCGAIRKRNGEPCRNFAVQGGRCRYHIVDEIVPADELEALRQLETAAAQHALDAHHALQGGEDENQQDEAFNRNARTAAQIARVRHALVAPKAEGEGDSVNMPANERDGGAAESTAIRSNKSE